MAGHEIIIGSRSAERAAAAAAELNQALPEARVSGRDNLTAAQQAEIVVLSVPYEAQADTLAGVKEALAGKLLMTVVTPIRSPRGRVWRLPSGLSAAEEAQHQVGEAVAVVAAFQNISAIHLQDQERPIDCDVLVCGDKAADKDIVIQLCAHAGMRGVNAGALQNASVAEGLTAVLFGINLRYKIKNAGLRITGI
jgi:NADPH-dependent F420 reductase